MKSVLYKITLVSILLVTGFLPSVSYSVGAGDVAPGFKVDDLLNNKQISLEQYKGQIVYLDFWASWCPPCLKSFPFMEQLKQRYSQRGLVVVAISLDSKRADAMSFLNRTEASFIIGHNSQGGVASSYDVQAMPSSYLIGRDGKVILRHLGFNESDKAKLEKAIKSALLN